MDIIERYNMKRVNVSEKDVEYRVKWKLILNNCKRDEEIETILMPLWFFVIICMIYSCKQ